MSRPENSIEGTLVKKWKLRNPISIFRDQKGIPDTLEVLSNVDSSRENFVDRSAVASLRATTINLQNSVKSLDLPVCQGRFGQCPQFP